MSTPIEGYPGYAYHWVEPLQQWIMRWTPEPNNYSPPVLDESVRWMHLAIPSNIKSIGALDLAKLARDHKIVYLYYRTDLNKIEMWSYELEASCISLNQYLCSIRSNSPKKLSD